jgi:hypothetical protein
MRQQRPNFIYTLSSFIACAVALGGCGEEPVSPSATAETSALAVTSTQALVFSEIALGRLHTCALTTDNLSYCWGSNRFAQLGDGTTVDRWTPVAVARGLAYRQVDGADTHTCGATTGNLAYCWGKGFTGRNSRPLQIEKGLRFRQVSTGGSTSVPVTCGITTDFLAYCSGRNDQGQLGDGTTTDRAAMVPVAGGLHFRQISPGGGFTCAITTDDRAYCWGNSSFVGNGSAQENSLTPTEVAGGLRFSQLSTSYVATCGVTTDHRAYCWGYNSYGEAGDGTKDTHLLSPTAVAGGLAFRAVSAGYLHSCGVTTGDVAYCWGHNDQGQLGDGTLKDRLTPVPVSGGLAFQLVRAGELHTCGVTIGNAAYCWGANSFGQLGEGTTTRRLRPRRVAGVI